MKLNKKKQEKSQVPVMDNKEKKKIKKQSKKLNREMAVVTYVFLTLFLVMAGYIVFFVVHDSDKVLNNPYNKRQDLLAKRVTKGSILSDTGKVLAETETDSEGNEVRVYPYGGLFAHTVGRTSHGRTGLESTEGYTMLTSGINPLIGVTNEIRGLKNPGNHVVTTLNVNLSQIADRALGSQKGAVVAIDPETGKILAMVSKPTYDPNNLTDARWNKLTADSNDDSALYNRATQGLYPPGSTFKLYTALEYKRENENYNQFSYRCKGSVGTGNDKIRCYGGEVHGSLNLTSAFAESCNTAFCQIGDSLDGKKWRSLCESFYYNKTMPLEKLEQRSSQFAITEKSSPGDIRQAAIGQGDTLVSPLQNTFLVCAAVNKGKLMKPYLVDHIEDYQGNVVESYEPTEVGTPVTEEEAATLKKWMRAVVKSGTATALYPGSYKAGGKTGSAEFQNSSKDSHAWFVGYAEKGEKKIVVSIVVEAAGTGSAYAVPIARKIFDAWLE